MTHSDEVSAIQAWILASRPKTLTAAIAPVIAGSAVAFSVGGFRLVPALAALFAAIMIQIATNFYNDVVDFERGTDTSERLGPIRVTQAGLLQPSQVRMGVTMTLGVAGIAGIYLYFEAGWPVLLLGLASIMAGIAYTGGPIPLARIGLGDLFTMVFFGFVAVVGTVYVQALSVPISTWLVGLALGSTITALLVVNNIRDIATDKKAGRRTIPVVWGKRAGLLEYILMLIVAYIAPILMTAFGISSPLVNLCLLSLPMAFWLVSFIAKTEGKQLNLALERTGQLVLIHSLLLSIGLLIS